MSLKVIELNDSAIRVGDAGGLLASSPGFALIGNKGLTLGDAAEKQAHLHPTQSVNKFWQQLSLEPLAHSMGEVRHFADLAYGHLLHLAELTPLESDVILAVPGNFTAHQLSIILGLTRQCPFNTVGVVDAALAAVIGKAREAVVIHADVQLHQVLLTRFVQQGDLLQRDSVIQIPGVGAQNFADQIMQLATNQFIQQCRFNPQHNAESEQLLYNELPQVLQQSREQASSVAATRCRHPQRQARAAAPGGRAETGSCSITARKSRARSTAAA